MSESAEIIQDPEIQQLFERTTGLIILQSSDYNTLKAILNSAYNIGWKAAKKHTSKKMFNSLFSKKE